MQPLFQIGNRRKQARNQLGTPGGAKSFPRGANIFWTMSNIFKLCPTDFSRGGEYFLRGASPPLVTGLGGSKVYLCKRCLSEKNLRAALHKAHHMLLAHNNKQTNYTNVDSLFALTDGCFCRNTFSVPHVVATRFAVVRVAPGSNPRPWTAWRSRK